MFADEDLHCHAMENIVQADGLLFGRVTHEMMEATGRLSTRTVSMPDWTEPFARTIDAARHFLILQRHPRREQLRPALSELLFHLPFLDLAGMESTRAIL